MTLYGWSWPSCPKSKQPFPQHRVGEGVVGRSEIGSQGEEFRAQGPEGGLKDLVFVNSLEERIFLK